MKANELKIGNSVMANKPTKAVDVLCDSVNTMEHEGLPYDMIDPIPKHLIYLKP